MGDKLPTIEAAERHCHRCPLPQETVKCISSATAQLEQALGLENARNVPQYVTLMTLLRAHTRPLPDNDIPFTQFQGQRLRVYIKSHINAGKTLPVQLVQAIRDDKVPGYPAECLDKLPKELLPPDISLSPLSPPRTPAAEVPWEERRLRVSPTRTQFGRVSPLDPEYLKQIRFSTARRNMARAREDIRAMLDRHYDGAEELTRRTVLLLEARIRHIELWEKQEMLRRDIWLEHLAAEKDGRRGRKGKLRVLKNMRKEYHKMERARLRREEIEERERKKLLSLYLGSLNDHMSQFKQYHRDVVRRGIGFMAKAVTKYHEEVSRHASRAEREAERARIQKLREDDEEGYLKLLRQTKNQRLTELLEQTDKHLRELGEKVKEQRAKSGVVEYEMKDNSKEPAKRAYFDTAHAIRETIDEQPHMLIGGTLKGYQLQGIQWMVSLYNNHLNGILADEMGLGKTIQTIGLIAYLMEKKDNRGPFLIVVPLSTMSNWEMEFSNWCPSIRTVTFKGDKRKRRKIFDTIIAPKQFNVCLVTYEYVVHGKNLLKRVNWEHIIIDEGQRLKNHESKLALILSKQYVSRSRLLLTGTPLQNSLTELWALLNFLLPDVFNSSESFESWFAAPFANMGVGDAPPPDSSAQLTEEESLLIIRRLHQVLRPFLLRRLKADVLRSGEQLPSKSEHIIMCDMSAWQKHTYYRVAKQQKFLHCDTRGKLRYGSVPNPAMQLKKCCNHPYLFFSSNPKFNLDGLTLLRSSGKFRLLDSVLTKLLRTNHRVLVFNQMRRVVALQQRLLEFRNIPFLRLDGATSPDERRRMVTEFNSPNTDYNVFLLTTRAGGLGVNLQTADTVIIFDTDWNPQMDLQAQDRAHRIGQRNEVLVLRFLTAKSVEEMIIERATFKRGLEQKIIHAGMFDENAKDSERQAFLRELLRIEEAESEGEDGTNNVPTDEEINQMIARSSDEREVFAEVDGDRLRELRNRPPLLTEKEIPAFVTEIPEELLHSKRRGWGELGNGTGNDFLEALKPRRASQGISYNVDRLTDTQYLQLIEKQAEGLQSSDAERQNGVIQSNAKELGLPNGKSFATIDDEFFGVERDDETALLEPTVASKTTSTIAEEEDSTTALRSKLGQQANTPTKSARAPKIGSEEVKELNRKRILEDQSSAERKRKKVRLVVDEDEESVIASSIASVERVSDLRESPLMNARSKPGAVESTDEIQNSLVEEQEIENENDSESEEDVDEEDVDDEEVGDGLAGKDGATAEDVLLKDDEQEESQDEGNDGEDEDGEDEDGEAEEVEGVSDGEMEEDYGKDDDTAEDVAEEGEEREEGILDGEYANGDSLADDMGLRALDLNDQEEGQILADPSESDLLNETLDGNHLDVGEIAEVDDGEIREEGEVPGDLNETLDPFYNPQSFPNTPVEKQIPTTPTKLNSEKSRRKPLPPRDRNSPVTHALTSNGIISEGIPVAEEEGEIVEDGEIADEQPLNGTLYNANDLTPGWPKSNVYHYGSERSRRKFQKRFRKGGHRRRPRLPKQMSGAQNLGADEGEITEAAPHLSGPNGHSNRL